MAEQLLKATHEGNLNINGLILQLIIYQTESVFLVE